MAYTKAPQGDSHNVTRIPALGSPFEVANNSVREPQTLNYVDCFPIKEEQFGEDPKYSVACREAFKTLYTYDFSLLIPASYPHTGSPPANLFGYKILTVGQLLLFSEASTSVYMAGSLSLYNAAAPAGYQTCCVFFDLTAYGATGTSISIAPTYLYFSAAVSQGAAAAGTFNVNPGTGITSSTDPYHLINDSGTIYLVAPHKFHSLVAPTYISAIAAPPTVDISRGLVFLDNYFFMVGTLNNSVSSPFNVIYATAYSGDPYGPWDTTNYTISQIFPGEIQWIGKHHNYLVAFNNQSIEFFYDAGNGLGSPLARQPTYTKNIGILPPSLGKIIAQDKDDIYFLGKNENNFLDVYLIRNFMVKPVGSHYIRTILNYYSGGTSNSITGIQTIALDNHTMILITFNFTNQAVAYFPESEEWWSMTTTDFVGRGAVTNTILGTQSQPSGSISTQRPYYLTYNFQNDAMVTVNTSDVETTLPITATYYSEVIDMDTSYWKHISKVMAVGDYGNRTLTLWYSRDPTYTTFTQCGPAKFPLGDGYQNAVWWDNVTRFRRGAFRIDMTGIGNCHHKAFDVVYNMGNL